jgi:5'-nucleotidase
MVKALNALNIDVACYGNHEFDFEEEHTIKLAQSCNFPWLLGNIKCIKTGRILGNGIPYITKIMENGVKLGIFGVAG